MRIAVTGSSGLIGTALVTSLQAHGHDVVRLVRRSPRGPGEVRWDPTSGEVDLDGLAGVDAAVNLAGAGVGDKRWTAAYKKQILDSRVQSTRTLVQALKQLDPLPTVLVSGSAVGWYGSRGEEMLTEDAPKGEGFLADVVLAWETEARAAEDLGIRVPLLRTGLVMAPEGGAFGRLLPLVRLGLGGPLGSGRQWWPWITLPDEVAAIEHLLTSSLSGPVNAAAPQPERNIDVTRAIARRLGRPALLPAPGFGLKLVLGEFADDVLASQRVVPHRLLADGFTFRHPAIDDAADWVATA